MPEEQSPDIATPCALVILARGGTYAEDLPTPPSRFDHQKSYFEFWLPFIGVREVRTLVVETLRKKSEHQERPCTRENNGHHFKLSSTPLASSSTAK